MTTAIELFNDRGEPATRNEIEAAFRQSRVATSVVVHVRNARGERLGRLAIVLEGVTAEDVTDAVIAEKETRSL